MSRWVAGVSLPLVATLSTLLASPAQAAPSLPVIPPRPAPVVGIPSPCVAAHPWDAEAPLEQVVTDMQQAFGITPTGDGWTAPQNRRIVRIVWQTLDAISCTEYVDTVLARNGGRLEVHAGPVDGWAWGDWGLTNPGKLTLDFDKWQTAVNDDPGRLVRLLVHEMGHAYNVDRGTMPAYWAEFEALARTQGHFTDYAGSDVSEIFSDVVGYYVARCAKDNPYTAGQQAYYEYARKSIFNGVEFGPAPGSPVECTMEGPGPVTRPVYAPPPVVPGWLPPLAAQA